MKNHPQSLSSKSKNTEFQKEDLIRQYMPLVKKTIRYFKKNLRPEVDRLELFENGVLGLVRALETYEYDDEVPFPLFAEYHIRNSIMSGLKLMKTPPVEIMNFTQIEENPEAPDERTESFSPPSGKAHDVLNFEAVDPLTCMLEDESSRLIAIALNKIPSAEAQVIRMTFYDNLSPAQISRRLSVSEVEVSQLRNSGLRRLRKHLLVQN
ncbi:MAG: sigma-70 family RNA polymerase sigma factor [SAR324 cluster bacterium]|uniref:Sigma-70 family RNA polymerase sigma factor n=1 Tax=SAR324 cluster bacterium TaxID=2024889 RepID=A0A7X9II76_9DELT|nr:sigma-70 family RNA polymerase sigma factor [SAR324 cluster bacterium]